MRQKINIVDIINNLSVEEMAVALKENNNTAKRYFNDEDMTNDNNTKMNMVKKIFKIMWQECCRNSGYENTTEVYSSDYPANKLLDGYATTIGEVFIIFFKSKVKLFKLVIEILPRDYLLNPKKTIELFMTFVDKLMKASNIETIMQISNDTQVKEDFSKKLSYRSIDFYRKEYHTRAKCSVEYNHDISQCIDMECLHSQIEEKVDIDNFLKTLSDTDKQICNLTSQGYTQKEIAEIIGFKTPSAISKRLKKIGIAMKEFNS